MLPQVGDTVKVKLPGESPWAECIEVFEHAWVGRITNKLFKQYSEFERAKFTKDYFGTVIPPEPAHNLKQGDVVIFEERNFVEGDKLFFFWEPVYGQQAT